MFRILPLLLLLNIFAPVSTAAQSAYIDSLEHELVVHTARDTNRAIVLYRLCWEYRKTKPQRADSLGNEALKLSIELNFQKGIGASYNNLGGIYENKGDDVKALQYYMMALDAKRKSGDPKSIASTLNNIGIIYKRQEYFDIALQYYHEAATINRETGNRKFLCNNYHNIANCHKSKKNYDSAFYYYDRSAELAYEVESWPVLLDILTARGNTFVEIDQPDSAFFYIDSAITVANQHGLGRIEHFYYHTKGRAFLARNNLDSAGFYFNKAWELVQETDDWLQRSSVSSSMAEYCRGMYDRTKDAAWLVQASDYLNIAYDSRDSLMHMKRQNSIFDLIMNDAIRQKDDQIKAVQQEKELVDLRADNERLFRNLLGVVVLAVALVLLALWLRFRKNKKLTRQLAEQNVMIEGKNKAIIDSITYAKRLQDAILPPMNMIHGFFPETFVLYLPKDIVAGDFYWQETAGDRFYLAAADCTGHGVPGAMVSVVCANALERCVKEFGIHDTNAILDKTRELVLQTFQKSAEMVNDGMDVSLISVSLSSTTSRKVQWSGANNPLWIVSNGKLTEVKPDKQPIGRFEHAKPFTAHELDLNTGDMLYLFTDGYADQFGGDKGKKFKYSNFEKLLVEISSLTAQQQHDRLAQRFREWKGNSEQVDDVCIIGLRL